MTNSSPILRDRATWDTVLVAGLSIHVLGLFLPSMTALQNLGLISALLISLTGNRWRQALPSLLHPLLLMTLLLVTWFALSGLWSVNPALTAGSTRSVFQDYLLVLVPVAYMLADRRRQRLFALGLAAGGAVIVAVNGTQYVKEAFSDLSLLSNIKLHRGWAHPLTFFLPFVLMQVRLGEGGRSKFWLGLFVVEVLMILASGARGAWAAMMAALLVWAWHDMERKWITKLAATGALLFAIAYFALPAPIVRDRITQGLDTSLRTSGTWGPALEMLNERPGLGYGFGKEIFDREFNRRAPLKDAWTIKKSKGPHSIFLEAGFSGGYPALVAIGILFLAVLAYGGKAVAGSSNREDRMLALAATAAFFAFYVVRGTVESVRWGPMIVLIMLIVHFSPWRIAERKLEAPAMAVK